MLCLLDGVPAAIRQKGHCRKLWDLRYVEESASRTYVEINSEVLADNGGLAQMVERPLRMREVGGSMPSASISFAFRMPSF